MIVTRFALPVRSPMPFIVPGPAWRPPRRRRACSRRRTRSRRGSGCRARRSASAARTTRARASAICVGQRASRWCRTATTRSAPALGGRAQAAQRVVRVVAVAVEEVLGVVDDALALRDEERDRVGDHREVLLARRRGRPSPGAARHVLPTIVQTGAKQSARTGGRVGVRARRRGAGSCRTRRSRRARTARAASSPKSSSSLGLDAGKPASIRCMPSPSRACTTRSFSSAVSDMPLALHPVAQGGVVELYVGHAAYGRVRRRQRSRDAHGVSRDRQPLASDRVARDESSHSR